VVGLLLVWLLGVGCLGSGEVSRLSQELMAWLEAVVSMGCMEGEEIGVERLFEVGTEVEAGPLDPSRRTNENGVGLENVVGRWRSGKVSRWRIRWQVRMAVGL
jgi:hypothetical protein